MILSRLFVYPLKAGRGIELTHAQVTSQGLLFDRRFMLVDARGRFVSQRTHPALALVEQRLTADTLVVSSRLGLLEVPLEPPREAREGATREVVVWGDRVAARSLGAEWAAYFSRLLEAEVELVRLEEGAVREVDRAYARGGERVGFADGFPFLLACEASRAALEREAGVPLVMERFRPNLVVSGSEPWSEDDWTSLRVDTAGGALVFPIVKPCARCTVTNVEPTTAAVGREPLATLERLRRRGNKVIFGQNLLVATELRDAATALGTLRVGDAVRATTAATSPEPPC
jgi:uncharacterized protein YcbX